MAQLLANSTHLRFSVARIAKAPETRRVARDREDILKYILLLIPCVLALAVPFYNFDAPRLFGFPFFYWFNLVLVPVSVVFIYAADKVSADK
jgi:uncharacterized membrane protein